MKSRSIAPAAVVLLSAAVIALPGVVTAARDFSVRPKIQRGLKIAPVPLNLEGKDRKLVGLGSYLVNAQAECVGCHTHPEFEPGGNPFLGEPMRINTENYMAGGRHFGPFVSPNLTPDENGNPGGLTFEQFDERMRTGMTPNHPQFGPFIQVMPWPGYSHMTDREMRAIYEYLRAIPHAEPGAEPAGARS